MCAVCLPSRPQPSLTRDPTKTAGQGLQPPCPPLEDWHAFSRGPRQKQEKVTVSLVTGVTPLPTRSGRPVCLLPSEPNDSEEGAG